MKRFISILLIAVLLLGMLSITAAAADNVISPEYDQPEDPTPDSPQTGYDFGVLAVAGMALIFGAAAVVLGKKAFQR